MCLSNPDIPETPAPPVEVEKTVTSPAVEGEDKLMSLRRKGRNSLVVPLNQQNTGKTGLNIPK
jgi:hypothetical protein